MTRSGARSKKSRSKSRKQPAATPAPSPRDNNSFSVHGASSDEVTPPGDEEEPEEEEQEEQGQSVTGAGTDDTTTAVSDGVGTDDSPASSSLAEDLLGAPNAQSSLAASASTVFTYARHIIRRTEVKYRVYYEGPINRGTTRL